MRSQSDDAVDAARQHRLLMIRASHDVRLTHLVVISSGKSAVIAPPSPNNRKKNRYISFNANNPGEPVKLKVTLTDSLPHPLSVGSAWRVQEPITPVPNQFPKPLLAEQQARSTNGWHVKYDVSRFTLRLRRLNLRC